jgi:Ser/Thr protein kinase RdoA (MazF antagonist)
LTVHGPDADLDAVRAVIVRLIGAADFSFERAAGGVSTEVYRVEHIGTTSYLRLAEEAGDDFAIEVEVLRRLAEVGVRVPDVVAYEACADEIGRSVMLTTAISGEPLHHCSDEAVARRVIAEAGRDVALINLFTVEGYGWLVRDGAPWPPRGQVASWPDWTAFGIRGAADVLEGAVFDAPAFDAIQRIVSEETVRRCDARLVHGDLDATPIFHAAGAYTGLIDFGELRGAEWWYDLAHFKLQDGQIDGVPELFDDLVRGYREVAAVSDATLARIDRTAVLIGVRQLARWMQRFGPRATRHQWFGKIRTRTSALLAQGVA